MDTLSPHADDGNPSPIKHCPTCGNDFPATSEFFRHNKVKKDGWQSPCKSCCNKQARERYKQPEVRERERDRVSAFYKRPEMRERRRNYSKARRQLPEVQERSRAWHRDYARAHRGNNHEPRERRRKTPEEKKQARQKYIRAYAKEYRMRPEVRERMQAYNEEYATRPGARQARREYAKKYHEIHYPHRSLEWRERKRVRDNNRIARKKGVPGTHTVQESKEQYQRQKGKCYWCSKKINWGEHHEDHIIPLSREGATNDISNIVITCPFCNLSKHDRLPHEWVEGGKLL